MLKDNQKRIGNQSEKCRKLIGNNRKQSEISR